MAERAVMTQADYGLGDLRWYLPRALRGYRCIQMSLSYILLVSSHVKCLLCAAFCGVSKMAWLYGSALHVTFRLITANSLKT